MKFSADTISRTIANLQKHYASLFLTVIFFIGCAIIAFHFFSTFAIPESDYNFTGKTKTVSLAPGKPIIQYFTAKRSNLKQIRVVTGNWKNIQRNEYVLFELADATCESVIANEKMTLSAQKQGTYTVFSFPVIPDSAGKKFCFRATFVAQEPRTDGKPTLSATNDSSSQFTDRILIDSNKNKTYENQTLKLRPAYTNGNLFSDLHELLNRISQYKPAPLKGWLIIIFFFLFILGSSSFVVTSLFFSNSPNKIKSNNSSPE